MADAEKHVSLTNEEIMEAAQELINRYTPETVPKCRVFGDRLSMQAAGRGPTIYGCSGIYEDESGQTQYREGHSIAKAAASSMNITATAAGNSTDTVIDWS